MPDISRRTVTGLAVAGVATPLLVSCGDDKPTSDNASGPLGSTSDIEVGGGTIFSDRKVVVTQPTAGDFKAFTSTCTHEGCQVNEVADGTINCPCHGSKYSIEDGSVQGGPAPSPLDAVAISVDGGSIVLT